MTDKACRECRIISYGSTSICPNCNASNLSDDFSGIVVIIDPEGSAIARAMKVKEKGHYALRVRQVTRIRLLTDELRKKLKNPQGMLIEGPYEKTMNKLKELIEKEKPSIVISVGDIVAQHMIDFGLFLNVIIIDNKTMRKPIQPIKMITDHTIYAKNPAGSITEESWVAIRQAFEQEGQTKIVIDGEEDLLALVAVMFAPKDALVVYGQPNAGIVVVKVTEEARKKMGHIVYSMKETSKS